MDIKVNFQSSILINNEIFIDPFRIKDRVKAKYIFITHPHFDHFSPEDIKKVMTKDTVFVCPLSMKDEYEKYFANNVLFVEPNKNYDFSDLHFSTIPAYNINKQFHRREFDWVGYILNIKDKKILITGDTDVTPELENAKVDIVLLPIGGYYTETLEEAATLINKIKPKLVIPTHYGEIVGNSNMGEKFKKLIKNDIKCKILL